MTGERDFLLPPYRVLDLTGDTGYFCGKILADLGADVIKIEPPGGDPGRKRGPFYRDIPHPEKSLFWMAYNVNKRGITLNLATADGRAIFRKLAQRADFVIESFPPGYLDSAGLGYSALSEANPRVILTSITPFGQKGPRKGWQSTDIVSMATGGFMQLAGDADRPPVRISIDQACFHGSAEGAAASLIAGYERDSTGLGQHVDVSIQASVLPCTINAVPFWELYGVILQRSGAFRAGHLKEGRLHRQQWPCKDGFVSFALLGGLAGAESNRALVQWMDTEGMADDLLRGMDWQTYDFSTVSPALVESLEERVARFFLTRTKEKLYRGAMQRRILIYPVNSIAEVVNSPQLKAREFWLDVVYPGLPSAITFPGGFARSTAFSMSVYRPAPRIGEHNLEIYEGEMGIPRSDLLTLKEANVI